MGLEDEPAAFKAEFARAAPADRPALLEAKIEEPRAPFAREEAIGLGARAPDFDLPGADGSHVVPSELLRSGPVVLTFYRGGCA